VPELPEVELYRRFFERHALGRRIFSVFCRDPLVVGTLGRADLDRVLPGLAFRSTRRHGKYLFALASAGRKRSGRELWVVFHFGMTGSFESLGASDPDPPFTRVLFRFRDRGALAFVCPRRFGRVAWIHDPEELIAAKRLGPDPLDPSFGLDGLRLALATRRGAIKALLLDQTAVAGVGNLYADEALFQSGIHPRRDAAWLQPAEWSRLGRALDRILRTALEVAGAEARLPRSWLFTRRREGDPCPRCGAPLACAVVAGRTTYFCPCHQPAARRSTSRRRTNRKRTLRGSPRHRRRAPARGRRTRRPA
jgi:formamidopyrimidine-DNA glycosylase